MKRIIYFLVVVFLISCSSDVSPGWDGTIEPGNKTYFNPPSWIQGVWINEDNSYYNVKFTSSDFIIHYDEQSGGVSYNERINLLGTEYLNCKEVKSTNRYEITITHLSTNITVWDFTFISESEIHCDYESVQSGERSVDSFNLTKFI